MNFADFSQKLKNGLTDTVPKKIILNLLLLLLWLILLSFLSSLLSALLFGFLLRPLLEQAENSSAVLSLSAFFVHLFLGSLVAFKAGKNIRGALHLETRRRLFCEGIVSLIFILPAFVLYSLTSTGESAWVSALVPYLPFLFFRDLLRFDALSVVLCSVILCLSRFAFYVLGDRTARKNRDR